MSRESFDIFVSIDLTAILEKSTLYSRRKIAVAIIVPNTPQGPPAIWITLGTVV